MTIENDNSPFTPGNPVSAELFTGRTRQIQEVAYYLKQAAFGKLENVFLAGDRGIGKSSFASVARRLAQDDCNLASVHVHLGHVSTIDELVRRILQELVKEGFNQPWYARVSDFVGNYVQVRRVGVLGVIDLEFRPAPEELSRLSDNFPEVLGEFIAHITREKSGVVIVLDDINGLAESTRFANWYKSFVDTIATNRNYQKYPALFMLCGIPERRFQMIARQPSVARIFRVLELERLSDEEVRDFFIRAFESISVTVEDDAAQLIVEYSSGLPVMMQEIGEATFWVNQNGVVNWDDAASGISLAAINVGHKYLHPSVYNALRSQRYQTIIRKIAQDSAEMTFTSEQMADILTPGEFNVYDDLLGTMRELGIVERDTLAGRGAYKYTNPIYPLYMWMEAQGFVQ